MVMYRKFFIVFFMFSFSALHAQESDTTGMPNTKSVLFKNNAIKPIESVTKEAIADTMMTSTTMERIEDYTGKPSSSMFMPDQDSAYYRLKNLGIPPATLVQLHARLYAAQWRAMIERRLKPKWEIVTENLNVPTEYYIPTGREQVQRDYAIMQSQSRPQGLPQTPNTGLQIPFSAIGDFFGLTEDVSPVLKYSLDYTTPVEIVIFSSNAKQVAVVFKGVQNPGTYKFTWNARDERGRRMTSGDYVAEVRIGQEKIIRKRIVLQ